MSMDDTLYRGALTAAERIRAEEIDRTALPCPICGSTDLALGWWCVEDGEVEALECKKCLCGAPYTAWQRRRSQSACNTPCNHG